GHRELLTLGLRPGSMVRGPRKPNKMSALHDTAHRALMFLAAQSNYNSAQFRVKFSAALADNLVFLLRRHDFSSYAPSPFHTVRAWHVSGPSIPGPLTRHE